jgi:hypothetical protein
MAHCAIAVALGNILDSGVRLSLAEHLQRMRVLMPGADAPSGPFF